MREFIRDWLRGYREEDVKSVRLKITLPNNNRVGAVIPVTGKELRALADARCFAPEMYPVVVDKEAS